MFALNNCQPVCAITSCDYTIAFERQCCIQQPEDIGIIFYNQQIILPCIHTVSLLRCGRLSYINIVTVSEAVACRNDGRATTAVTRPIVA